MKLTNNTLFSIVGLLLVFFYLLIVLVNFFHNSHDHYIELKQSSNEKSSKTYIVDPRNLKKKISNILTSEDNYKHYLNRECSISKDLHDRHKLRWVKEIFLKKILQFSSKINEIAPYYINIILHSSLILITLIFINKTFLFDRKYNFLFLLYVTFIFQQYLGEYSYSIFEMFFLSAALYASKKKNIYFFIASSILATLNRESGFIILITWLIFNKEFKIFISASIITMLVLLFLNLDLKNCLLKPEFYGFFVNQTGQINFENLKEINIISKTKLFVLNFVFPFGLFFYFYIKNKITNNVLLLMVITYGLVFLIATPIHHVSIRLILLPLIFAAIDLNKTKNINT